jgi:hypothetical protein
VPKDVTGQASRHYRQILKFVNTDAHRRAAWKTGADVRRSNRDVLMRNPDEKAGKIDASIQQALGRETSNVDSAEELATAEGLDAAHRAFAEHILPGLKDRFATDRSQGSGWQRRRVTAGSTGTRSATSPGRRLGRAAGSRSRLTPSTRR